MTSYLQTRADNQLRVGEFEETLRPHLLAVAGTLRSTERYVYASDRRHADRQRARIDLENEAAGPLHIGGIDRTAKPVVRIVGKGDDLLVIRPLDQDRDRPEQFLLEDRVVRGDVRQDRRLDEPATLRDGGTKRNGRGADFYRSGDLILEGLLGLLRRYGADVGFRVHRVANLRDGDILQVPLQELVLHILVDEEALGQHTPLPCVGKA